VDIGFWVYNVKPIWLLFLYVWVPRSLVVDLDSDLEAVFSQFQREGEG
jgi:hypothetical protein